MSSCRKFWGNNSSLLGATHGLPCPSAALSGYAWGKGTASLTPVQPLLPTAERSLALCSALLHWVTFTFFFLAFIYLLILKQLLLFWVVFHKLKARTAWIEHLWAASVTCLHRPPLGQEDLAAAASRISLLEGKHGGEQPCFMACNFSALFSNSQDCRRCWQSKGWVPHQPVSNPATIPSHPVLFTLPFYYYYAPRAAPTPRKRCFNLFLPGIIQFFHVFVPKFQLNSPQHLWEFCWTQALHLERMEEKGKWDREANSHFCLGRQMHRHAALTADKEPNPCNCCSTAGCCGLLPDAPGLS